MGGELGVRDLLAADRDAKRGLADQFRIPRPVQVNDGHLQDSPFPDHHLKPRMVPMPALGLFGPGVLGLFGQLLESTPGGASCIHGKR